MTPTPAGTDAALAEIRLDLAARTAAYERVLRGVKTEVMTQEELAGWFIVGKNKIRGILEVIAGAEKVAGGWRVPVHEMPATYQRAVGLLQPIRSAA